MDQTYLHLLTNHVPVIGSILGAVVLVYGIVTRSGSTKKAAYLVFILSALVGTVTFFTGEAAEETAENLAGVVKATIEPHEDAGKLAMIGIAVMGVAAFIGFFISEKRASLSQGFASGMVVLAFVSFGLSGYAALLGGKIRHTEITNNVSVAAQETGEMDPNDE